MEAIVDRGLTLYLESLTRFKPLTAEDELSLWTRWDRHGCLRSREKLVNAHLKFAAKCAWRFHGSDVAIEDLISEANMGLMIAVEKYRPGHGTRFATYAAFWIKCRLHERTRFDHSLVRKGTSIQGRAKDASLNVPAYDSEGTLVERQDLLVYGGPGPEDIVVAESVAAHDRELVVRLQRGLTRRQMAVIERRILADEPQTLREVGIDMKLSAEGVRLNEVKALRVMRRLAAAV